MSYRPLSPGKTEKTGSPRDRVHEMASDLDFDTPFVPAPPFPCYEPVVCAGPADIEFQVFPATVVTDTDDTVVTDTGDTVIADAPEV